MIVTLFFSNNMLFFTRLIKVLLVSILIHEGDKQMIENKDRVIITSHIKSVCKRQLIAPIIVIVATLVLVTFIPFKDVLNPESVKGVFNVKPDQTYIEITTGELTYTGYDMKNGFGEEYSYYYAINNKKCVFVLVPARPITKKKINNVTFKAKVIKPNSAYDKMVSLLAKDLNWTEKGLKSISSDYIISAADYNTYKFIIAFWIIVCLVGLAFLRIILAILGLKDPYRYPVCSFLTKDESHDLIDEAQEELDSENYLHINDAYITENYFIALDPIQVHIIPLKDIIWV